MMQYSSSAAAGLASKLVATNIESTDRWVEPEEVTQFMETVYKFLVSESKDPK